MQCMTWLIWKEFTNFKMNKCSCTCSCDFLIGKIKYRLIEKHCMSSITIQSLLISIVFKLVPISLVYTCNYGSKITISFYYFTKFIMNWKSKTKRKRGVWKWKAKWELCLWPFTFALGFWPFSWPTTSIFSSSFFFSASFFFCLAVMLRTAVRTFSFVFSFLSSRGGG